MKVYIKSNLEKEFILDINVYHNIVDDDSRLVATEVLPLRNDDDTIDDYALGHYQAFVENIEEILDYYDFVSKFTRNSETSYYGYYAHKSQIEIGSVPKYIRLRISDHVEQHKSEEHRKEIKEKMRNELEKIKLPKSKRKQRYILQNVVVNETTHGTYEEALNDVEQLVRSWVVKLGVDIEEYDNLGE